MYIPLVVTFSLIHILIGLRNTEHYSSFNLLTVIANLMLYIIKIRFVCCNP